jgi:hypothetical protein
LQFHENTGTWTAELHFTTRSQVIELLSRRKTQKRTVIRCQKGVSGREEIPLMDEDVNVATLPPSDVTVQRERQRNALVCEGANTRGRKSADHSQKFSGLKQAFLCAFEKRAAKPQPHGFW